MRYEERSNNLMINLRIEVNFIGLHVWLNVRLFRILIEKHDN